MKNTEGLAEELFQLVEGDQGRAFISDGIQVGYDLDVYDIARASLFNTERVACKLRKWLKDHGQVTE